MRLESEKLTCKYVFNVKVKNKSTLKEKIIKYTCIADSYMSAMTKAMNMVKVDPKFDFLSAELKEKAFIK